MPPMVAREAVEMSTGNHSPWALSARLRSSRTMPGSTAQRRPATSSSMMRSRWGEQSLTSEWVFDCLAALRGAAAAREHAHALLPRDRDRALGLRDGLRLNDAERRHLVMRG